MSGIDAGVPPDGILAASTTVGRLILNRGVKRIHRILNFAITRRGCYWRVSVVRYKHACIICTLVQPRFTSASLVTLDSTRLSPDNIIPYICYMQLFISHPPPYHPSHQPSIRSALTTTTTIITRRPVLLHLVRIGRSSLQWGTSPSLPSLPLTFPSPLVYTPSRGGMSIYV